MAESIYENYIAGKDDEGKDYFKLENETPKPFFQISIQHIDKKQESASTEEEKNLLNSYNEFYSYTSKETGGINPENFLDELVNDAELYVKISSPVVEDFPQQEQKELYRSLLALKTFNVSQHKPFLLNIFKVRHKDFLTLTDVKKIICFIEKFHFCFNAVCSMRPSGIEQSYSKATRQLFDAKDKNSARKVIEELKQQLLTRLPEKDKFKDDFSKLKYLKSYTKDKKLIQYIFSHIESVKQTTNEFKPDSITLEHILSQSSGTEDYIGMIGNLLPLGSKLNGEAGTKKLVDKIEIYKKSNFILTQEFTISNPEIWGEEEIKARTSDLAEDCYNSIWSTEV